jgi:hypothetical protein
VNLRKRALSIFLIQKSGNTHIKERLGIQRAWEFIIHSWVSGRNEGLKYPYLMGNPFDLYGFEIRTF